MTNQATVPASPIRSFSLAASLAVGLALGAAMPAEASSATTPDDQLTGAEIASRINAQLARHRIAGTPAIGLKEKHNPCPGEIKVAPLFKSWKTVKVTCPANPQWRLLIRVAMEDDAAAPVLAAKTAPAETESSRTALALARSMGKGEVILAEDVLEIAISAQQDYGIFRNPEDIIGRRVRTPITANAPIKSRQLEPRYLVEEKKPVLIAISSGGIYVEMSGISLQNGQLGETIKVENLSSGKTVTGKVIGLRKISPLH